MRRDRLYLVFIGPSVVFVVLLSLYPSLYSIFLSFTDKSLVRQSHQFVGFHNYVELFGSQEFWSSLRVTIIYVLVTIFLQLTIGLCLALLTNQPRPGRKLVRTLVLISWIIPEVIVALTFKWMFIGDRYGLVNSILLRSGLISASIEWLSQPRLTLMVVIGMTVWRGAAFSMIMQAAGLQSVPDELLEAAEIDGANGLQRFCRITLPLLRPTILINLIIISIATFNVMSLVYAFSGGGPFRSTEVMSIYMYKSAFKFFRLGFASTIAIVMFALNTCFTLFYVSITRRGFTAGAPDA